MAKFMQYGERQFWKITGCSAVRPFSHDSLEILTLMDNGEVQYRKREVSRWLYKEVKSTFQREGIA